MSDRKLFEKLPERVRATLRPSLRIRTSSAAMEQLALGQSRIGGVPDLPPGFVWPRYKDVPLAFIAQLNLADLRNEPPVLPLDQGRRPAESLIRRCVVDLAVLMRRLE